MKDHYGFLGSLGFMVVKETFDNSSRAKHVKCPTIILHGKKDKLVAHSQSVALYGMALLIS